MFYGPACTWGPPLYHAPKHRTQSSTRTSRPPRSSAETLQTQTPLPRLESFHYYQESTTGFYLRPRRNLSAKSLPRPSPPRPLTSTSNTQQRSTDQGREARQSADETNPTQQQSRTYKAATDGWPGLGSNFDWRGIRRPLGVKKNRRATFNQGTKTDPRVPSLAPITLGLEEQVVKERDNMSTLGKDKGSTLKRINVVPNSKCEKAGMKSYASLLKKYDFTPTTAGPYQKLDTATKSFKNVFKSKSKKKTAPVLRKIEEDGKPGEVKAEDQQNDALYICPVQIGSPPQTLNLHFDTGSSDLWVWSTELDRSTQKAGASKHNIFNPKKSTTYKKVTGSKWRIRYGDGSNASGIVGTDNVTLGGLCIENQAIELANKLSNQFTKGAGDGLLGLAFGKINTVRPKTVATPVENMISQEDIPTDQELFTCYLGSWRDADEIDKGDSFYTFGYIDEDVLARCNATVDSIHYVPVDTSKGFWQFKSESATVGGKRIDRKGNTAIADTGTTLALVDDKMCKTIYEAIPGAKFDEKNQGWVFPIGTPVSALPKVTFAVGDKHFEVQKEDFGFAKCGGGMQYGGIQSRGNSNFDILGDTWLKAIYAVFDQGRKRFGAVQRIEEEQNIDAPE